MTDTDLHEGTAVEIGTDLEPVSHATPTTLFRTDDPVEVVERASRVADALKTVLDRQGLTAQISGKRHVLVEGWTTLGAMVGVTAVPVWTKPLEGDAQQGKTFGFEARVEARTLDGRVIGAAEAMCTRAENRWKTADDYAIRSMAQTRATSKALRGPLGFVVTLAGYMATPAEEMPADAPAAQPAAAPADDAPQITANRARELVDIAWTIGANDKLQLAATHARGGNDVGDCSTKTKATVALRALTVPEAEKVDKWLGKKADEAAVAA